MSDNTSELFEDTERSINKGFNNKIDEKSEVNISLLPEKVKDLIMWKSPAKTIAVLLTFLTVELSLLSFSVISVLAYCGLGLLAVAMSFRLYVKFSGQTNDRSSINSIKNYLNDSDALKSTHSNQSTSTHKFIGYIDNGLLKLRGLLLIEDYLESMKLAFVLYLMTYIGARFNFMTLCILCTLCGFLLPKVYFLYRKEIDHLWSLIKQKLVDILNKIKGAVSNVPVVGGFIRQHSE